MAFGYKIRSIELTNGSSEKVAEIGGEFTGFE